MGCGMSLCCKPTGTSFLESSRSKLFKPSATSIAAAGYNDHPQEEGETIDDFEKELQLLNDEIGREEEMSPPPTLDESMSDNETSLIKIAAVVTSKTGELLKSVMSTSPSQNGFDGAPEIQNDLEDTEEAIDAFTKETLQEDALDLELDASSDSFKQVSDEKPPAVHEESIVDEHLVETTLDPTEEAIDVEERPSDSDAIEETDRMEPQKEVLNNEEDFSQENQEEEIHFTPEMTDVVDSSTPQAEEEVLLNSSPLEDLSGSSEIQVDDAENTEIVGDQPEELQNAGPEPINSIQKDDDASDVVDVPMDSGGMEETGHPELCETVNETDHVENELQEIDDEELPQVIEGEISETNNIEEDILHEKVDEEEQIFDETVDVEDGSTLQAEEESSANMVISNSFQLETESGADGVENQEINQFEDSDNTAANPSDLAEYSNEEQQSEDSIVTTDIPLSSQNITDLEEACPVVMTDSNQLEETGLVSVEDELNTPQEHDQEFEPFDISYLKEHIQEEDEPNDIVEYAEEENDTKMIDTENEENDDEKKEMDEIQYSAAEVEGSEISGTIDEQPSQIDNNEEILSQFEDETVTKDPEPYEIHSDGDLQQDVSFIEDKSPFIHANEDNFIQVEDTEPNIYQDSEVLPEENANKDIVLGNLTEEVAQQDEGFSQDVKINDDVERDANDDGDAVHLPYDETDEEVAEKLHHSHESLNSVIAGSDGNHSPSPNSDLENEMTAIPTALEVEDRSNEEDQISINAPPQSERECSEIGLQEEGETEILNCIAGVALDENSIQEDNKSTSLADTVTEDGLNAQSAIENVTESEPEINEAAEAESNDTSNYISCPITEENHDLQEQLIDEQRTPDLKTDALLDGDLNELLYEGEKEASNADEEEIWSKLQKDLQLEEEEEQMAAAIKIQSTFRGYKCRKEFNQMLATRNEDGEDDTCVVDDVENVVEDQVSTLSYSQEEEPLENNDHGNELTGALAVITESIATAALIMTDTPQYQPPLFHTGEDQNDELDGNVAKHNVNDQSDDVLTNQREVNDVTEEPMPNGEEIRDIQLLESYVITSSVADSSASLESQEVIDTDNSKENESTAFQVNDDSVGERDTIEAEAVASDPGVVFEFYVESNETVNDGLLESYCLHREDPTVSILMGDMGSLQDCSTTAQSAMDDVCFTEGYSDSAAKQNNNIQTAEVKVCPNEAKRGNQENVNHVRQSQPEGTEISSTGYVSDQQNKLDSSVFDKENLAATKIQAGFRGHQDRKRVRDIKNEVVCIDNTKVLELENAAATKIQAGFRGQQDRKRMKKAKHRAAEQINFTITEEKWHDKDSHHLKLDPRSLELEIAAATKIQAGYRGHQDRKRIRQLQQQFREKDFIDNDATPCTENLYLPDQSSDEHSTQNACLEKLENAAATKIQASFRGYQDRKNIRYFKKHAAPTDLINEKETNIAEKNCLFGDGDSIAHVGENSIEEENAAAIKIQAGFRGHQDRKRVKCLKDSVNKQDDIISGTAGYKEETIFFNCEQSADLIETDLENTAATKIQAGFRGHQDRKRVKDLQRHVTKSGVDNNEQKCTDTIPAPQRLNDEQNQENLSVEDLENSAATKIQASFRGHQDRKKTKLLKNPANSNDSIDRKETIVDVENCLFDGDDCDTRRNWLKEENNAATKIQAGFRGHRERKRVKFLKDSIMKSEAFDQEASPLKNYQTAESIEMDRQITAATKIQAGFRGHQDRKRVKNLQCPTIENHNNRNTFTDIIPTARHSIVEQSQENLSSNELENIAATKIQAGFRGYQERKNIKHFKNQTISNNLVNTTGTDLVETELTQHFGTNSLDEENSAAIKIQAGFRGQQDRKRVKYLKDSILTCNGTDSGYARHDESSIIKKNNQIAESIQEDLENTAATKIQAGFRGHQDRKRLKNSRNSTNAAEYL